MVFNIYATQQSAISWAIRYRVSSSSSANRYFILLLIFT